MRGYRYEALDGLRGLAAQVVLASHALGMAFPHLSGWPAGAAEWVGRLAVMVFFSLSGFVIATSLGRLIAAARDRFVVPYAVHRLARIWPPLILAIVVTFAVGAIGQAGIPLLTRTGEPYRLDLIAFLRGITLTFGPGDATFVIDRALWSLRQEVYLYGVAVFAALAIVGRGMWRVLGAAVVLVMVAATANRFFYLQSLALFAAGAGAAVYGADTRLRALAASPLLWPVALGCLAAPIAFAGMAGFIDAQSENPAFLAYQAALGLPFALCLLDLATRPSATARAFERLSGTAGFSYTLYVIHVPVMTLVFSLRAHLGIAPGLGGTLATLAVALILTEAVSFGAALVVERPRFFRAVLFRLLRRTDLPRPGAVLQADASPTRAASPSR